MSTLLAFVVLALHSSWASPRNEFAEAAAAVDQLLGRVHTSGCRTQLKFAARALANSSLWAVQMLDASAKLPVGLIVANTYHFGHYDECVDILVENVQGKYCLGDVHFRPSEARYPEYLTGKMEDEFSLHYDPHKSVWEKFKVTADPSKKRRDTFHLGMCIPDRCTARDAQVILDHFVRQWGDTYGYHVNTSVEENACSMKETIALPVGAKIIMYLFGALISAVVVSTAWDLSRNRLNTNLGTAGRLLESFSFHRTMTKLGQTDRNEELSVFNGMKFYTIALIVLGHRCVHTYGAPFFNPQFLEQRYRMYQDMFLLNGSLIVDTFFTIGGYLTCYGLLRELQAGKRVRPVQVYLYRWLRMTPMYMLVVFCYGHLLENVGSGPIWRLRVGREAERCRDNWWTNLLFVNNYVNNQEMCMFQSWYVSCDMQFTLLTPMLVACLARRPARGVKLLLLIIFASTTVPFAYTYYYQYDGVLRVYMQIFEDLPKNRTFADMYIKAHHRATPYFVGMIAAYISNRLQQNKFLFPRWLVWVGSSLSTGLSVWAIWGAWPFYIPGREYDALENATYAAAHRLAWSVSMAWIPVAAGRNAFGILTPILSKQSLAPLSRLSFGAFLVHGAVQLYFTGSMRMPQYVSFPILFWMTAGDAVFSFLLSFFLHVTFEAPVNNIVSIVLSPKAADTRKVDDTTIRSKDQ